MNWNDETYHGVTLVKLKGFLKIFHDNDDSTLSFMTLAAVQYVKEYLGDEDVAYIEETYTTTIPEVLQVAVCGLVKYWYDEYYLSSADTDYSDIPKHVTGLIDMYAVKRVY
ncbi:head-tail connector protein [Limibacter armeniacum]|uniref:head-tail connector protein n=1 Tax=Limibacter armeniacum TaxID=466084 RepID=UPI002FE577FA